MKRETWIDKDDEVPEYSISIVVFGHGQDPNDQEGGQSSKIDHDFTLPMQI